MSSGLDRRPRVRIHALVEQPFRDHSPDAKQEAPQHLTDYQRASQTYRDSDRNDRGPLAHHHPKSPRKAARI